MTTRIGPDPASFRDPSGRIYRIDNRIFRTVSPEGAPAFEAAWKAGVYEKMALQKRLIETQLLSEADPLFTKLNADAVHVLTHPTLPAITYPYEWSFAALKSAAIAHLDLQLALLDDGFALSDASAFNMQFDGAMPQHIDVLSVIPYQDSMYWAGYRQFLQHFFNPLVLESQTGVSFAPFFRATLEGIASSDAWSLLPWSARLSPGKLLHIALPAWGERRRYHHAPERPALPKHRYYGLLKHLRSLLTALKSPRAGIASWRNYTSVTSYSEQDAEIKQAFVSAFISRRCPSLLLDIGCNTGAYAALAIEAGAQHVIGIDADRFAVDAAFERSAANRLPFTPLVMDIANPSPSQGWNSIERAGLTERIHADAMMALAILHHLCIGKNIPLAAALEYLTSLAPAGLIEFVPKSDPQVLELLRHRKDIFPDYTLDTVRLHLAQYTRIIAEHSIGNSGRILFEFERLL